MNDIKHRYKKIGDSHQDLRNGKPEPISMSQSKPARRLKILNRVKNQFNDKLIVKIASFTGVALILSGLLPALIATYQVRPANYELSNQAQILLGQPVKIYADKLVYEKESNKLEYNKDYAPGSEKTASGLIAGPRFSASFELEDSKSYTINDVVNETAITFTPKYDLAPGQKSQNSIVYPLRGLDAQKVISLKASKIKEDIIVNSYKKDNLEFKYELGLPSGLEARLQNDGSVGIFGVTSALLGSVSTSTEADAELLEKARQNSEKNQLMFTIPAPFVVDSGKKASKAKAIYELNGKTLTIKASQLSEGKYPISIDPSVYIETAAKLMKGNNETNIDFDIDNELIQKSQTTGARIDAWSGSEGSVEMNNATWDHSVAAAGGYVYRAGGITAKAPPSVVDQTTTIDGSDGASFIMNMPTTRPAGDLYVAMMCHDGTGTNVVPDASWTEYADTDTHAAYYKIGQDISGGNEAATYTWTGASEQWAGVIVRVTGFDSGDILATAAATTSGTGTPQFPTETPDNDATLVLRSIGIDTDEPENKSWVPTNHEKIASSSSTAGGGTGTCGFTASRMDVPPISGAATGATTLGTTDMNDNYGSSTIAINGPAVTPTLQTSLYWAKFNNTTRAVESPTTGDGACTNWCTKSSYDFTEARRGLSLVAYNGFLYAIGGSDGTNRESTVWIAKIGANGEPSLWHPTGGTNVYWYADTGLSSATARSYLSAYAYNNKMYIAGGQTNASATGTTTMEYAVINPNGTLGSWSSGTALPAARHGHSIQVYNDVIYLIGGANGTTPSSTVYYAKLNTNGSMNSWTATTSLTGARTSQGGNMTSVSGGYIYLAGGCSALDASNDCSTMATDIQLASINADGSLAEWNAIIGLNGQRIGGSILGWQGGLYRFGGCQNQNVSGGACYSATNDADYGVINPAGEVSTVNISSASGAGTCTGGSPYNCNIPDPGDDADEGGSLLSMTVVMNGYLYNIGGCLDLNCDGTSDDHGDGDDDDTSGNIAFVAIDSQGRLTAPSTCAGTSYGAWCVDAVNRLYDPEVVYTTGTLTQSGTAVTGSGTTWTSAHVGRVVRYSDGSTALITARSSNTAITVNVSKTVAVADNYDFHDDGIAAAGIATFNNRIYLVGGVNGTDTVTGILYNDLNTNGSLNGAWENVDMTTAGIAEDIAYTYAYARANPGSAGTNPGNLYVFGGCGAVGTGLSCGTTDFETEVYKCNITTSGTVSGCTTTGQTQIDSDPDTGGSQGLGIHSGTVYANYIYLIGGFSETESDKDEVIYTKFDNSNNVVESDGAGTASWTESPNNLSIGRRRGFSFGYNGHIYSVGGYDGSEALPFIEWAKINVSDGSIDAFQTSSIEIAQRWGLSMVVSNSYAYVIGGCDAGGSPDSCTSFEPAVQTFQLYNNDSGAVQTLSSQADDGFATNTDRWGASSAILNGYLYVAGGCISATDCTNATSDVQFASISATDGSVGTWTNSANDLPPGDGGGNGRAWGQLEVAGGNLYYLGGQEDTATTEHSAVYYASSFSSGDINAAWSTASGGIGDTASQAAQARTRFSSTVWNNRIYVVGGLDSSAAVTDTVYISPQLSSGGNIAADSWTYDSSDDFTVSRTGAAVLAYANNLYLFGGFDGTNYLNDAQFTQINADGSIDSWTYTTSLPANLRDAEAVAANGYIYLIGGRSAASTCAPNTLITPVSANTTIATGNNPTGIGEWYETNTRYTGDRYGTAVAYSAGKIYMMGGGCSAPLASTRHYYANVKSQPMVAKYSRMIDTDTDVFPTKWLMNGVDNSIGASWQMRYSSMHDLDTTTNPNEDCGTSSTMAQMTTWGTETNYGNVTLGTPADYIPRNGSTTSAGTITQSGTAVTGSGTSFSSLYVGGILTYADGTTATIVSVGGATSLVSSVSRTIGSAQTYTAAGGDINCARYYYLFVSIDASQTFGYPEDVDRGPTIFDLSLFFTADPSKRLRHGKTFTGGQEQPLDTPF